MQSLALVEPRQEPKRRQVTPSLGAIAMLNVVYEGFLALHGTKKLWIVQMV